MKPLFRKLADWKPALPVKWIELSVVLGIIVLMATGFSSVWTQTGAPTNSASWLGITASANGRVIMIVNSGSPLLCSTNAGGIWATNVVTPTGYTCGAASADGTKLVAPVFSSGHIAVSVDSGNTWVETSSPVKDWRAMACSANGSKLFAGESFVWFSTDFGSTWQVSSSPSKQWRSLASSADGSKVIGSGTGQIYISTNGGTNWTVTTVNGDSVATSADGRTLLATGNGSTYTSTNAGGNWRTSAINAITVSGATGNSAAMSADGRRMIIGGFNGQIYTSADSGLNWETNNAPTSWRGVASSADGYTFFGSADNHKGIWIGQSTPAPQLNLKAANGGLAFSWTLPSTNFVLQQNPGLGAANWTAVPNVPVLNLTNLQQEVLFLPTNGSSFFRLMAQ